MADVGTGVTIVFGTSGFSADIESVNGQSIERPVVETSHMGTTTYKTFMPGDLTDPGGVEFEFHFDPDEQPPITSAAETITITFPIPTGLANGATLASSGFIASWSWGTPLEDKMVGNANVKFSGTSTWSDAT